MHLIKYFIKLNCVAPQNIKVINIVDFNNDTTITQPRKDIVNFIILQRHTEAIDKLEDYEIKNSKNMTSGFFEFKGKVLALYWTLKEMIKKEIGKEKDKTYTNIQEIETDIKSSKPEDVYKAFDYLNSLVYAKKITMIDTKKEHDRTDLFTMNEEALGND